MRLDKRSRYLLSVTKSKAKLAEFDIEDRDQIAANQDPRRLLITTIGILGELSAIEARRGLDDTVEPDSEKLIGLKKQLIAVGQYFDALDASELASTDAEYLKIIGAAAYYLADMPGSSNVLSKKLSFQPEELTPSYLEGVLVWILKFEFDEDYYIIEESYLASSIVQFVDAFLAFYNTLGSDISVINCAERLRKQVYDAGDNRELLFVDVIFAIALRRIRYSAAMILPKSTGLVIDTWGPTLEKKGFTRELWPAQRLLCEKQVMLGSSAVIQMPTSAGKTKSIELIIRSAFLSNRAELAVVIAPFRALCREITSSFENVFDGESIKINELQDIPQVIEVEEEFIQLLLSHGDLEPDEVSSKKILVSTPEKLVYILRQEPSLAKAIDLMIFDEGHQFDSGERGVTYELLLANLNSTINKNAQKILISAVISNAATIGDWLNGEQGVIAQDSGVLSTERSVAFVSWTGNTQLGQLTYIDLDHENERDFFVPRIIDPVNLGTRGRETVDRIFPQKKENQSVAAYLGLKFVGLAPVAIFCGNKTTVTSICKLIVDYYERGLDLPKPNLKSDQVELDKIAYLAKLHYGENSVIPKSITLGVLPHSATVPNGIRVSSEWAMENEKARFVVCTSTLAQGVNLPIKYLIVSNTFQGGREISTRDFHNLIGRAGRAGYHTEGNIIFADHRIYDGRQSFTNGWRWARAMHLLDFDNAEDCLSSLKDVITPFDVENIQLDIISFVNAPYEYRRQSLELAEDEAEDLVNLVKQFDYKDSLIHRIESYFLSHIKENNCAEVTFFEDLTKETLAYHLATDQEKEELLLVMEIIAARAFSVDKEKVSYFGKTLLGIRNLTMLDEWVDLNRTIIEQINSTDQFLDVLWPLITEISNSKLLNKIKPESVLLDVARSWVNGESYNEIHRLLKSENAHIETPKTTQQITISHVIEFADQELGFDLMLVTGSVADIMEGRGFSSGQSDLVRTLQSQLKIGLKSKFELFLYSRGVVDREVCKLLSNKLVDSGVSSTDFSFSVLSDNKDLVSSVFNDLPSYFRYKVIL